LRHHLNDPAVEQTAAEIVQRLGAAAATLARFFPELDWPTVEPEPNHTPDQEKRLLHHGLTRYLFEVAAQRPLLLIIEDLHWSDDATLEFLLTLVRRLAGQPIFLLLTYRGNEIGAGLSRFLAEVERQRMGVELVLAPLTTHQVDEMMRAIFELKRPVRGEFLLAVSELTEGTLSLLKRYSRRCWQSATSSTAKMPGIDVQWVNCVSRAPSPMQCSGAPPV
jgi:predicted ATPase